MEKYLDFKTEKLSDIINDQFKNKLRNMLVVGCGSGKEAATLAYKLNIKVVGIDIENNFDKKEMSYVQLSTGDATSLQFNDSTFDFVYCYHVLEHILNPLTALKEIRRVLIDGGGFCIGTPNKSRLFGYIGSKDATTIEKIKWNLTDWKARIRGRFKNQFGAHAGFTSLELNAMLQKIFPKTKDITKIYYREIYSNKLKMLSSIDSLHLSNFLYPSIYFIGTK